ncbi:MAG: hypothetical protein COV74_07460 [Candidatus Omnitrophica bacterium CG11_big_fil_rev_8_21_14_0_20_45_26]|uniref:Uncharacterized protein n=1 Tax=Candidatus Abzuiibacterium crystallinum TaxID=1974748 RepID=A0A2H0LQ15_9BACT|nr:MAG: hypothetical protein COV74_07460 [Candidatus Omnitrophica bacterium CG11_big_fil_rev_8_21_14_0_20_45_26]PIW64216.1 MAG: hypothetical protein COW12_07090 [Candidatus Omnitrophica bacterium CG12_big_fil_rev_8_21_14_0_65_45_16]
MKRNITLLMAVFAVVLLGTPAFIHAQADEQAQATENMQATEMVIADFDTGDKPNNIGGDFGSWDKDPADESQYCNMSFEPDDMFGDPAGYSIRLDYDVNSSNPAYNGFWMKLNNFDASGHNTINFGLKGDAAKGYTKRIKIELKDANGSSPYIVSGITDEWQQFSIPFEKFRRIKDWSALTEFVVVFDDINSVPKEGSVYFDNLTFSTE